jgi:ribosome-associated protein
VKDKKQEIKLEPLDIARRAVELASDKQAEDIVLLDTRQATSYTDYVIVCSAESDRQLDAIFKEILDTMKKELSASFHTEGTSESGWILLDYLGVVIHIFSQELRDYYKLESIYDNSPRLLTIQ